MSGLPNCERAFIRDDKLLDYALSPSSERGQHKARVFESALGFNLSNWQELRQAVLTALPRQEATLTGENVFGRKYQVKMPVTGPNGRTADALTVWQFDRQPDGTLADAPRLVTIYIPESKASE